MTSSRNHPVGKSEGGVMIAVKNHIKCSETLNETMCYNKIVAIELHATSSLKSIIIASKYVPPKAKICSAVFHKLHRKWNPEKNARGRQLQELLEEGYIYCIDDDSTTYERNDYDEKRDWILTSQPLFDHKPLTFELSIGMEPKPTSLRIQFNFKVVNWIKFRKILNEQLQLWDIKHTINTSVDIEECNAWITKSLLTETYQAIPKSKQANWNYTILGLGDRYG
ncbi:unnamed protein product [Rotaria magnacalcarata]|uniref:Uncharacterized protein n=2 Tax=Rotaria magnacalcarata TaxID=392030 RepID=A0A8S2K8Q0_9BILA|nr:unnamed protein product [Rotaria magnacalcarata]CAF3863064.1 unnamed protein product [Rotaria magnacalcarata]CAF4181109.1 unnamed protein product [Rotaria magnacalcarata]